MVCNPDTNRLPPRGLVIFSTDLCDLCDANFLAHLQYREQNRIPHTTTLSDQALSLRVTKQAERLYCRLTDGDAGVLFRPPRWATALGTIRPGEGGSGIYLSQMERAMIFDDRVM